VKSAAAQAVERLQGDAESPLIPMPAPANLPWLVAFAAQRKTGLAPGAPTLAMLERAIREGEPRQRAAAVELLAAMAQNRFLQDLCMGLSDSETSVRSQAFEGLWALRTLHAEYPKE
jgi:HEAT repeat protein